METIPRPVIRYLATGESKEKDMKLQRTRGGSLGKAPILAGELEEAGVPQRVDGKEKEGSKR